MTTEIEALDEALAAAGEDIVLRRITRSGPVDVACRACVRTDVQTAEPTQTGCTIVLSPTDVIAGQLPGRHLPGPLSPDPGLPKVNDQIIVQGRLRNIVAAKPFFVAGELVRIELTAEG